MQPEAPRFSSLPPTARTYVAVVCVAGAIALTTALVHLRLDRPGLFAALLVLAIATSAAKIALPLGQGKSTLSLSYTINFWALLTLGFAQTACIAALSAWWQCTVRVHRRNPPYRIAFSVASIVLTVSLASLPLAIVAPHPADLASLLYATAAVAPVYFLLNSTLVGMAVALSTRERFQSMWAREFLWSAPAYLVGASIAAAAAYAAEPGWSGWLALLTAPLYLLFRSYDTFVGRLRDEQSETRRAVDIHLATIEALALAIEAKAGCSPEHIRSIQHYAGVLADAAGLPSSQVQAVRTAALLHDIGNLAVPEHILSKPERLTPEEFERIKIHPRVGEEILRRVPFGSPVGQLVLSHHERWDGLGYPAGLRGDAIPVGARILAIADTYSTLCSHRPYRPARSHDEAISLLREQSGTAFDPMLVELFAGCVPAAMLPAPIASDEQDPASLDGHPSVALQDIAGAHHEALSLYEIALALGSSLGVSDAMALIDSKVGRLVPFTTCALFLGSDDEGYTCRYAQGPGSDAVARSTPRTSAEIASAIPRETEADEPLRTVFACPLVLDGRVLGALVIYHTMPNFFTDEHRRVVGRVCDQAAAVIYNSIRFEQTQRESETDALTGLANRRSLERQLESGLARVARTNGAVTVIVLDADCLKQINDTYGHQAGDRALRTIASVLRTTVRNYDVCCRFAGDEFVVVLWDSPHGQESRCVAELEEAVAACTFEPRPGVRQRLSISAGAARCPEDGRTVGELLSAADARMYATKARSAALRARQGRHKVRTVA